MAFCPSTVAEIQHGAFTVNCTVSRSSPAAAPSADAVAGAGALLADVDPAGAGAGVGAPLPPVVAAPVGAAPLVAVPDGEAAAGGPASRAGVTGVVSGGSAALASGSVAMS